PPSRPQYIHSFPTRRSSDLAITGAVAASYYGIPRTTLDADFVVYISPPETNRFFRGMKEAGVKADIQKIRRLLKSGYNVITVAEDRKSTRLNSSHQIISYAV